MKSDLTKESRFLTFILRHKPDTLGLTLDKEGWVSLDALIEKSRDSEVVFTKELLTAIVADCKKQRFQLSEDGTKIRCHQGHSLEIELGLERREPPEFLFHGTATRFLGSILSEGLKKQSRHHVHLSAEIGTAKAVGSRYGKVVVLRISAKKMFEQGYVFYLSGNGVWLTDSVPPDFIEQHAGSAEQ